MDIGEVVGSAAGGLTVGFVTWFITANVMRGRFEEWKKNVDGTLEVIYGRIGRLETKTADSTLDVLREKVRRLQKDLEEESAFWRRFRHDTYAEQIRDIQQALQRLEIRAEVLEREVLR